ncbi:MAG: hypothetical protein WBL63_26305 [Candidatus Acidiferrum sp.]
MKEGMKLNKFKPIETEYENAAPFPDEQSAEDCCKEMNGHHVGWIVEEAVFNGEPCWKVVWLGN